MNWKESELENFACENIHVLGSALTMKGELNLIGTQIDCVFGRIDMLCWHGRNLFVVEFKAVHAGEKEFGQVSRYCSVLDRVVSPYKHMTEHFDVAASSVSFSIVPVIVAPSFDEKLFSTNSLLVKAEKVGDSDFKLSRRTAEYGASGKFERKNRKLSSLISDFEKHVAGLSVGQVVGSNLNNLLNQKSHFLNWE